MNPIKITIFLLSIEAILVFWFFVFATLYKSEKSVNDIYSSGDNSHVFTSLFAITGILNFAMMIYLSYQIPYSIFWLMTKWNWG